MRKNERGYSLIELITTLAIFSVLMLVVIVIMRTSLASYKDSLFETEMQEEAQIVANQVSDLLIDAQKYSGYDGVIKSYTDALANENYEAVSWGFVGTDGNPFYIRYDSKGHRLYYDNGSSQKLADNITSFSIDDISSRPTDNQEVRNNLASISVSLDGKDTKKSTDEDGNEITTIKRDYSATKWVYFRNNIEDAYETALEDGTSGFSPFDVSNADPNDGKDEDSSDALDTVYLKRYETLDLSAEYNMVSDIVFSEEAKKWFQFTYPGAGTDPSKVYDTNTMITKCPSSISNPKHYVIKINQTKRKAFNEFVDSKDCYITGTILENDPNSEKGAPIVKKNQKIIIKVDAVSIDRGAGIISAYRDNTVAPTENGYASNVIIKGININEALVGDGTDGDKVVATCSMDFKNDGVTVKDGSKNSNILIQRNTEDTAILLKKDTDSDYAAYKAKYLDAYSAIGNSGLTKVCVIPDPVNGGLVLTIPNSYGILANPGRDDDYMKAISSNEGKSTLDFTLTLNGTAYTEKFYFTVVGTAVDNFKDSIN